MNVFISKVTVIDIIVAVVVVIIIVIIVIIIISIIITVIIIIYLILYCFFLNFDHLQLGCTQLGFPIKITFAIICVNNIILLSILFFHYENE